MSFSPYILLFNPFIESYKLVFDLFKDNYFVLLTAFIDSWGSLIESGDFAVLNDFFDFSDYNSFLLKPDFIDSA